MGHAKGTARERVDAIVTASTLAERTDALVALVRWTRYAPGVLDAALQPGSHGHAARLDELLDLLDDPEERLRIQAALATFITETDGTNAFAHAGIPSERGLLAELGERAMNRVLPRPRDDNDLGHLLFLVFHDTADTEFLSTMSPAQLTRLVNALYPAARPTACARLRDSFANSFRLLATSVQAHGLSPKLRMRSRPAELTDSAFYRITPAGEAVVARWLSGAVPETEVAVWRLQSERCREELEHIHQRLEREGVSTDVVYALEVIERCLARMAAMVEVMMAPAGSPSHEAIRRVIVALATSVRQEASVTHLLRWNTHLLQRRIVERSGQTGEHYVTESRAEYRHMWLAAAGAGLVTVATGAIKNELTTWHVSEFAHGVTYGLNYALSFLVIQHLGFVLATKQPAMTAAALATIVRERRGEDRVNQIAGYAARICRSQFAALLGNVIAVSVGAYAFVHLWRLVIGHPLMSEGQASATYLQFSPVNSGTVFYAALTGVILWLASVVGGWFDNFCAYHRLPEAIALYPTKGFLTRDRLRRWGHALSTNASGWATNVSLGFMLGMTPVIGKFFGLPLDVRHVTLNAGMLSLAAASLERRWFGEGAFLLGVSGVVMMFVLNLSVSFLLALVTAARAYELPPQDNAALARGLYTRFKQNPLEFFIPPRTGTGIGAHRESKVETTGLKLKT